MKYIDEFRHPDKLRQVIERMNAYRCENISLMEFCGGHTVAILKYGIRQVLPDGVRMLSGPGCPVCVTDNTELDRAMEYAVQENTILVTYGDMLRVPGSYKSLSFLKAEGADIRFVYSPLDALKTAETHPDKRVIFFAVGFETSAPAVAATILAAQRFNIKNFLVSSALKLTPPAARAILEMGEIKINGIVGPGHVSTIIGREAWDFIPRDYSIPVAISGFEPLDLLLSIEMLLHLIINNIAKVDNEYTRSVTAKGNIKAKEIMNHVFEVQDSAWRGLGVLPASGLNIKKEFETYDAGKQCSVSIKPVRSNPACKCAEVLRGLIESPECPLYKTVCTPVNPVGPCMVSSEGSCAAYFYYGQ
ncbi:MAG: hydrogenase formation protein HypD [Candidatus Fischerbacteria bacterium RBG_13_37_8]|uniref:Hydrogenase formation protein HypD n=1 Tax=Candidatus Fischerbacteria bacterium RBG_13_37_8 TaxID=1817863 RepID=A0A1F5VXF6_9BACT|nr:MAG: hydrogenase formation protein HypD [Candidatus Fischerbacteria bacterium RBG_13_37_8]